MANGSKGEKKKSEIWLWHRRLGHAFFGYLKKLFPSLFAKSDISGFRCDICELAKSHCASFPLILNKSPLTFMLIHYNVWGPSKVPTLSVSLLWYNHFMVILLKIRTLIFSHWWLYQNDMVMLDEDQRWSELFVSKNFIKWLKLSTMQMFGFYIAIMVENIRVLIFKSIWKDMASFIILLVPIHPKKMESLNRKIGTC